MVGALVAYFLVRVCPTERGEATCPLLEAANRQNPNLKDQLTAAVRRLFCCTPPKTVAGLFVSSISGEHKG